MDRTVPSSTSSSEYSRGQARRYLLVCFAVAVGAGLLCHLIWQTSSLREHVVLDTVALPPPSSSHYLSVTDVHAVDALVYEHELEDVCPPIRAADVLFVGNSRLQFAIDSEQARSFFAQRGLRYYMLGFPLGTDRFVGRILEKCGARPSLVVAFATGFFRGDFEKFEEQAVSSGRFGALKTRLEFELAFLARRLIHRLLPHPVGRDLEGGSRILHRSTLDGSWSVAAEVAYDVPVFEGEEPARTRVPGPHLKAAERLRAQLGQRGSELVLAYVPSSYPGRRRARQIATRLGVPLLDPWVPALRTRDGVHLVDESAKRYSAALLRQLESRLPSSRVDPPAPRDSHPQQGARE